MAEVKGRPSERLKQNERDERNRRLNALLDAALQMTFPASDPVAIIHESEPVVPTSCILSRAPQ
jgi:hypothetical protein